MLQLFLHNRMINEILLKQTIMYKITQINMSNYDLIKSVYFRFQTTNSTTLVFVHNIEKEYKLVQLARLYFQNKISNEKFQAK